jgi:hypothetical protein
MTVEKSSRELVVVETPLAETLEKVVAASNIKRRNKGTQSATISLEAHLATSSLNDVSIFCALLLQYGIVALLISSFLSVVDAEVPISWH